MQQSCLETKYKWIYPEKKSLTPDLVKAAGSRIVAQLLLNRNIDTPEKIKAFLDLESIKISSPYKFDHMEKSVERINSAVENQEHIVIFGDFDADGVTSTSLLYKTLKHINADVSYYIPDRSEEGHGLNSASICKLISTKKAKLIITVDCGISNISEITLAKGLGTDIIITDHHEPPEVLPPAFSIINPKTMEEDTDLKYLAGVGVAFKLACALLESNNKQDYIDEIYHLVALGTIADVVPLLGENRALVYRGLKAISKTRPASLIKLLETAGYKLENGVTSDMIAFGVAPRINAVGRLEKASVAVELLVSDNSEEIDLISKKLNANNRVRQQMCENTFIEANGKIKNQLDFEKNKAIILADQNWHPGIIGIVASKLVEKYYKPALMISIDEENKEARCSARSIAGLNLHDTLTAHSELFTQFGGHALAAGFSFDLNKVSFEKLKSTLNETINENLSSDNMEPKLIIDKDILPEDLTAEFITELEKLIPYGECNPPPVFSISNLTLKQYKTMGSANNHLKLFLADDNDNMFEAVWWQKNSLNVSILDRVNVAFNPEINTFGGKTRIQLVVKDIQPVNGIKTPQDKNSSQQDESRQDNFEIKWIDHRNKNGIEKIFSNYLKTSKDRVIIYAENQDTIKHLENDPVLKTKLINRTNIEKADQLVFFDLPSDIIIMSDLIKNSEVKMVHLIGKNYEETDPKQIIRFLSGMLKFAYTNKNGEADISYVASKLFVSNLVIGSCIKLLDKANIISIQSKIDNTIKFEFIGSANFESIMSLQEYTDFVEAIKIMEEFHHQINSMEIESIQNLISKFKIEPAFV